MVMPFYEGPTLKQRAAKHGPMSERELLNLVAALLGALDTLHRAQCFHRDISLANVLIPSAGTPVLLDFGAARKSIGDAVDETSVMLKPGYSPIEQYTDDPAFVQGPWTDIYSLGAVMHAMIVGEPPPAAVVRSIQDTWQPLASREFAGRERYTLPFLDAVDHALALRTQDRPDSVAAFARLLGLREAGACVYVAADRARDAGAAPPPDAQDDAGHEASRQSAPRREPSRASAAPQASNPRDARDGQTDGAMIQGATGLLDDASKHHPDPDATVAPPVGDSRAGSASTQQQRETGPRVETAGADSAPRDARRMWAVHARRHVHSTLAQMSRAGHALAFAMKRRAERIDRRRSVAIAGALALIAVACVATYRLFEYAIRAPGPKTVAAVHAPVVTAQHVPQSSPAGGPAPRRSVQPETAAPATTASASQALSAEAQARATPAAGDEPIASAAAATDVQTASPSIASGADLAQGASASDERKAPKLVAVRLQVYPWGEVYVGGIRRVVSPPLKTLSLAPGQYDIELRNGRLPPIRRTVRLDPGSSPVNISYRFE
jgi:non-specific serine/threonine protein kinase